MPFLGLFRGPPLQEVFALLAPEAVDHLFDLLGTPFLGDQERIGGIHDD